MSAINNVANAVLLTTPASTVPDAVKDVSDVVQAVLEGNSNGLLEKYKENQDDEKFKNIAAKFIMPETGKEYTVIENKNK